ncbi:alpha/beta hydrolase family protein [Streptomyces sp. TLI_171]|uniref:alpha/beta hydrolase n=1 Tax=Streptomyces sp. TLI_171 TaxID=1938859 RepID=UPI000C17CA2F|nr:alpha/beta hydrolase-fold protein [Streptomyces sp. TLI_171]
MTVNPLDWSLLHGAVPVLLLVAGWVSLLGLAVSGTPRWWTRRVPLAVLVAAALTALIVVAVDHWWHPFPEDLPNDVVRWIAIALLGLCLAAVRLPVLRRRGRVLAPVAAALVVSMAASEVNRHYQEYPTLRAMLAPRTDALPTGRTANTVAVPPGRTLSEVWRPPSGLPAKGTLSSVAVPGTTSGFRARDGYVYLPPAYRADPRPLLPVVVLMAGQPGSPADWVNSGGVQQVLDDFAAAHGGLAPVVVMVDPLGSELGNTLCMDSSLGKVQTYLAQDVPDWVRAHLQTATDRRARSIGGISFGGTCSLQLAVNAPQVYGSFADLSGQSEPTLGSHDETVKEAFGGDESAFDAVDPAHLMARRTFPDTAGLFMVGSADGEFEPQQRQMYAAATAAGMHTEFRTVPGGHNWSTFHAEITVAVPWLARQQGLIR